MGGESPGPGDHRIHTLGDQPARQRRRARGLRGQGEDNALWATKCDQADIHLRS